MARHDKGRRKSSRRPGNLLDREISGFAIEKPHLMPFPDERACGKEQSERHLRTHSIAGCDRMIGRIDEKYAHAMPCPKRCSVLKAYKQYGRACGVKLTLRQADHERHFGGWQRRFRADLGAFYDKLQTPTDPAESKEAFEKSEENAL
jgi:hypothetical protein